MSLKEILNDLYSLIGSLLVRLFALLLVSAPNGAVTITNALLKSGVSGLVLALSFFVLESGRKLRSARQVEARLVPVEVHARRRRNTERPSRADW